MTTRLHDNFRCVEVVPHETPQRTCPTPI